MIRDAATGRGVGGAEIHARNITRTNRFNRMDADIKHDVTSARGGDYWRLLTPGEYEIIVQAHGYAPQAKLVQIYNDKHTQAVRLDFDLSPAQEEEEEEEGGYGDYSFYPGQEPQEFAGNFLDYSDLYNQE